LVWKQTIWQPCCQCENSGRIRASLLGTRFLEHCHTETTWGRCYDHNVERFFPMHGKKWRFSWKPMLWSILSINWQYFKSKTPICSPHFFGENIY
jgi:hypothetical protein